MDKNHSDQIAQYAKLVVLFTKIIYHTKPLVKDNKVLKNFPVADKPLVLTKESGVN